MCKTNIPEQISPCLEEDISYGWLWAATFFATTFVFIVAAVTAQGS